MMVTASKKREAASAWPTDIEGDVRRDGESVRAKYSRLRDQQEAARHAQAVTNDRREFPRPVLAEDMTRSVRSDPGYLAVWGQLQSLTAEVARLDRECAELQSGITTAANTSLAARFDARARALIAGDNGDAIGVEQLRGTLAATRDKAAVTRRAVMFVRQKLGEEAARASREIVERVEPEHRELIARMGAALVALGEAIEAEQKFRDTLALGHVMLGTLRAMPLLALGKPTDRQSRLAAWLIEALQNNLIERSAIPREWLKKWEGA